MIAHDHGRTIQQIIQGAVRVELHPRDMVEIEAEEVHHQPTEEILSRRSRLQHLKEHEADEGAEQRLREEHRRRDEHRQGGFQRERTLAIPAIQPYEPLEDQRRKDIGHQHHREHTDDGDLGQRTQGRVTRHDQRADADKHDQGREDDAVLIGGEHLPTVGIFVTGSLGHEDGIVITLSEDESGQDDVYDIKLDTQKSHQSQNPNPADGHRKEGEHRQFDTAQGEPEEEEHDKSAGPANIVEVVGETVGNGTVHPLDIKGIRVIAKCLHPRIHLRGFHPWMQGQHIDDTIVVCQTVHTHV